VRIIKVDGNDISITMSAESLALILSAGKLWLRTIEDQDRSASIPVRWVNMLTRLNVEESYYIDKTVVFEKDMAEFLLYLYNSLVPVTINP
jgi:hypothetical protein